MGIMKRMSGLVSANLNDLIDQCENPEKMLKQAVREMETALGQLMDGAARAIAHHKLLARQLEEQRAAVARKIKLAEEAVARGDDAAARLRAVASTSFRRASASFIRIAETCCRSRCSSASAFSTCLASPSASR